MNWENVAASVTGEAHLKGGKGNEDAFCLTSRLDGSLVLAVADGAGSASYGAEGAELATTFALATVSPGLSFTPDKQSWPSHERPTSAPVLQFVKRVQ